MMWSYSYKCLNPLWSLECSSKISRYLHRYNVLESYLEVSWHIPYILKDSRCFSVWTSSGKTPFIMCLSRAAYDMLPHQMSRHPSLALFLGLSDVVLELSLCIVMFLTCFTIRQVLLLDKELFAARHILSSDKSIHKDAIHIHVKRSGNCCWCLLGFTTLHVFGIWF